MNHAAPGPDGILRCHWCLSTPEYIAYHDHEWGFPVVNDTRLFEKICLEGFQSGLSWRTILAKRENFRKAFKGFDVDKVARFTERDVERLLQDTGIVRHRGKIEATIHNARCAQALVREAGSLSAYFWRHQGLDPSDTEPQTRSTSPTAIALSKDLKKRGWKFVGPTTVYAFMQAMGLINDHATDCAARVEAARARPGS
ncbi:MAG: DNA-3-methyladenine glycosylase I [Aquabacterium sp.]|jgi:DNA-3-methyladenine glycosylase I|uniref:DNA-3-methyladenine glycosylase I n=1 Tax=Aquabacterium sp. TaxID=1872578 RepID=UPI003BB1CA0E